jgi:hypothetical protein
MRLIRTGSGSAEVELWIDELMILNNALNEILNGVSIPGFHARIGADREEAERLMHEIGEVKRQLH